MAGAPLPVLRAQERGRIRDLAVESSRRQSKQRTVCRSTTPFVAAPIYAPGPIILAEARRR